MSDLPVADPAETDHPADELALCLSGGGYRAMVFHLGVVWYLHDAGLLPKLDRVSSVSGGSIAAGVLATRWKELEGSFDASGRSPKFGKLVVNPIRKLAGKTIDIPAVLAGFLPGITSGSMIIRSYRRVLFGKLTLQDLPDRPRFVFNATNVQTGSLFRFSKPYLADWRVGMVRNPTVTIAQTVAASSAFPPVLSPAPIDFEHGQWSDLYDECGRPPFTTRAVLTDAGVFDNLGLEPVWKRCRKILVSDAGGRYLIEANPHFDWVRHTLRVVATSDNQVRSMRKRQVVGSFVDGSREGAYFGTWVKPSAYRVHAPGLPIDDTRADELARTPTRLARMSNRLQNRLINFGYGMAERAVRSYFLADAYEPKSFPCPGGV